MYTLIISGGRIDESFAAEFCRNNNFDRIISADRGLEFIDRNKLSPTDIVGDFDSLNKAVLERYRAEGKAVIHRYPSEKDATDTEIALQLAIDCGSSRITVLGATGTRVDHMLGNIQLLAIPLRKSIPCEIIDAYNRITLLDKRTKMKRADCFGEFVSLLPLTTRVTGLTLEGFKYPLHEHTLTSEDSLGISNELVDETGMITFDEGILIRIESKDE